ncbi:hypothetical protein EC973_001525 [Apophysomyces ossiformis]|uniref:Coth-domain-containing protein n=1 Tax=Apophysomyces ossiformis TaxID=679940 RepID=A0A8H7BK65_9FUNG|nr:hypothetical protein EC973_001525 [Apophysomyces ossiformis]
MMIIASLFTTLILALAAAKDITYSVIIVPEEQQTVAVVVDQRPYTLQPSSASSLLYTGKAPAATQGYYYSKLAGDQVVEKEGFMRSAIETDTPNEFYNRSWNSATVSSLPTLLSPLSLINHTDLSPHLKNEIVTYHFEADQDQINQMHQHPVTNTVKVRGTMTRITLSEIRKFTDVEMQLSGHGTRSLSKHSYKFKLPKQQMLAGYRHLKLRSLALDPSYIRERMSYDIFKSAGIASTDCSYVRVFMNKRAYGLYGLVEVYKKPWIENEFYAGQKHAAYGILYEGRAVRLFVTQRATLAYRGDDQKLYADGAYKIDVKPSEGQPADYTRLMELTKFLANAPLTGSGVAEEWERHIDTESIIRNMALEITLGLSDNYITSSYNYFLYDYCQRQKFIYIPTDTEFSFGSSTFNVPAVWEAKYQQFPGMAQKPPLVTKLLQVPQFKQAFEYLLVKICKDIFDPDVINPYIDSVVDMIREDVTWDQSLPRAPNEDKLEDLVSKVTSAKPEHVLPPYTIDSYIDLLSRAIPTRSMPLDQAVKGPTGHVSVVGVKEWMYHRRRALLQQLDSSE